MPDRLCKDVFLKDAAVSELRCWEQNLLYRLFLAADDYGRFDAHPRVLLGYLYPHAIDVREADVSARLRELERAGFIRLYEVDGQPYLLLMCWRRFVRVDKPAAKSKYPAPAEQTNLPLIVELRDRGPPEEAKANTKAKASDEIDPARPAGDAHWPSLAEVKAHAATIGLAEWVAEIFWTEMESVGWKFKGQEVQKWQALLVVKKKYWEADGRPMEPKGKYAGNQRNGVKGSRNVGTFNEGGAEQYRLRPALPNVG